MREEEDLKHQYYNGLKNLKFSNPGGIRVMANTSMGESLYKNPKTRKTQHKINKLEIKIEHERQMRKLAEKEVERLKLKFK